MTRAGPAPRVLVVDDDPAMGETLTLYLTRHGFAAMSRLSAHAALELIAARDFDVVVTDVNMDEMNGLALCAQLRVLRPGLPVIVTTGFGAAEARVAALAVGAYEFLSKPIDLALLRSTIERAVQPPLASAV